MSEYREIRGSLQGERCEHKSWADLCDRCEIDRFRAENEKLRAALLLARKYVLVQSCELSLQPEDAARDLDVIDEALEKDED